MSTEETLEIGIAFADRALKHEKNAREAGNHSLYQKAITDYTRATEMFSLASIQEYNAITKQMLRKKIAMCRDRQVVLQNCLTRTRTERTSARKREPIRVQIDGKQGTEDCRDVHKLCGGLSIATVNHNSLPSLKDVAGLEKVKEVLSEATMLPKRFPNLFEERRTWRTILLYGPTGVGKTFISKAIAGESKRRFFSLTGGDLLTDCGNEYENRVQELFGAVRRIGKVVFCCDDIDIMFSSAGSHESEELRRVKGQFLKELEKLRECKDDVLFIATSRRPWMLEEGLLGRMDKRMYIGLPDAKSRKQLLEKELSEVSHTMSREDIENMAKECELYSGSDMKVLVMDAEMERLRVIQDSSHFRRVLVKREEEVVEMVSRCSAYDDGAMEMSCTEIERNRFHVRAITCVDLEIALDRIRPTVGSETVEQHMDFTRKKGEAM